MEAPMRRGTLSYAEFEREAVAFAVAAAQVSQRWEWVGPAPGDERFAAGGGGYLCLRHVHRRARPATRVAPAADLACEHDLEEADVEEPDAATLTVGEAHQPVHVYDYHVVHSEAYGVPVLFLRGCTTDGAVLPAETVWQDVCAPNSWPVHHPAADWLTDSGLPTPGEHPITGEALLMVHPCRTQQFMSQALSLAVGSPARPCASDAAAAGDSGAGQGGASGRGHGEGGEQGSADTCACAYLVMWLSVFAGAVGLRLPLQLLAALPAIQHKEKT